jgi:hypothetical protein
MLFPAPANSGSMRVALNSRQPDTSPMNQTTFLLALAISVLAVGGLEADETSPNSAPAHASEGPSFRNEVMAVLSRSGCSLGTCHGNQNGKGGLKLSLRGQDPDGDFLTLTRQLASRRTNALVPEESLLLRKPLMQVPHEGGRRFQDDSTEYQILLRWIEAGMPNDSAATPRLDKLIVQPDKVTIHSPQQAVILKATGHFSDNTVRDVSHLTVFESSNPEVEITAAGEVRFAESAVAQRTSINVRYLHLHATAVVEHVPDHPDFQFLAPAAANRIDEIVFDQLQRLKINPSAVCDDTTFLRRVFLDLTGQLPTAAEARDFMSSTEDDKRARLIDRLLASEGYVEFQTLRWADLLRVEDKTLDTKGVQVYHHWIRDSVSRDKPLNQFAAEIIAAKGSTYTEPPSNFYRALRTPEERSESVAQVFLGIRLQCAKCHNHPFDRWTQDDYYGWTNFFARIDYKILENRRRDQNDKHEFNGEQIVFLLDQGDVKNPTTGQKVGLRFLGDVQSSAPTATQAGSGDRLQVLANWLRSPDNRRFAATQANRIWFQLMGTGIVDPVDDFRATNPPSNPELLEFLTTEFVRNDYSVRELMRLILNSTTYQLSAQSNSTNAQDEVLFSHVVPRRLSAEQTLDAIGQVLQTSVAFGGHPKGTRAVQLMGVRNGGHRYSRPENGDLFLSLFGKPGRLQTCECERTTETTLAQTMEMVTGEVITELLSADDNSIQRSVSSDQSTSEFLDELFWSAVSRAPTTDELQRLEAHVLASENRMSGLQDAVWAVLNSNEFLLRQ